MSWSFPQKMLFLFKRKPVLDTEKVLRDVWREQRARERQIKQALEEEIIFLCQHCQRPLLYNEKTMLLECPTPELHPKRNVSSFPGYRRRYARCETHLLSEEEMDKHLHKER